MSECVDTEARQQISALKSELIAIATDYWGKDGTNGHRSRSTRAQSRLDELERAYTHYLDKTRQDTCFGVEAMKEHEKEHEKILADAICARMKEVNEAIRRNKSKAQLIAAIAPYMGTAAALIIAFKDPILAALK